MLAVAAIPAGGGVALQAVGVVAAVGLVLLLGRLALHPSMSVAVVGSLSLDRIEGGPAADRRRPVLRARGLCGSSAPAL